MYLKFVGFVLTFNVLIRMAMVSRRKINRFLQPKSNVKLTLISHNFTLTFHCHSGLLYMYRWYDELTKLFPIISVNPPSESKSRTHFFDVPVSVGYYQWKSNICQQSVAYALNFGHRILPINLHLLLRARVGWDHLGHKQGAKMVSRSVLGQLHIGDLWCMRWFIDGGGWHPPQFPY